MFVRCTVAGSLVAAAVLAAQFGPPDTTAIKQQDTATPVVPPADAADAHLQQLRAERLETARCIAESYRAMHEQGQVSLARLMVKEAAVLDAEFHLATSKAQRLAIRRQQLELAKQRWDHVAQAVEAGAASENGAHESRVALLDAEIALLCERTR